jgi:hypothetical protein
LKLRVRVIKCRKATPRKPPVRLLWECIEFRKFDNTYLQLCTRIMIMRMIILEYGKMKIIIFLDLQKIMYDFIDPKFFQIDNVNNLRVYYIHTVALP